ncbi:MAG: hypothetical protein JWP75_3464 [Frondihabitans sp.]|nr:hypothetical protein [Frondihabitans sp.]
MDLVAQESPLRRELKREDRTGRRQRVFLSRGPSDRMVPGPLDAPLLRQPMQEGIDGATLDSHKTTALQPLNELVPVRRPTPKELGDRQGQHDPIPPIPMQ